VFARARRESARCTDPAAAVLVIDFATGATVQPSGTAEVRWTDSDTGNPGMRRPAGACGSAPRPS